MTKTSRLPGVTTHCVFAAISTQPKRVLRQLLAQEYQWICSMSRQVKYFFRYCLSNLHNSMSARYSIAHIFMICFMGNPRIFVRLHKEGNIIVMILPDDVIIQECRPYAKIIADYADLLTVSVKSMNGNLHDLFEQCRGKHKCSDEEFRYIERLLADAVKALEHTIDTANYFNSLFRPEKDIREGISASVKLCEERMNETNRLLASGYETDFTGGDNFGGHNLTKLLAKAAEIYAASINKNLRTLIGRVSSIDVSSHMKHKISKEAFQKMEDLCKFQGNISYSAAEISAYFNNLVRSIKNKK